MRLKYLETFTRRRTLATTPLTIPRLPSSKLARSRANSSRRNSLSLVIIHPRGLISSQWAHQNYCSFFCPSLLSNFPVSLPLSLSSSPPLIANQPPCERPPFIFRHETFRGFCYALWGPRRRPARAFFLPLRSPLALCKPRQNFCHHLSSVFRISTVWIWLLTRAGVFLFMKRLVRLRVWLVFGTCARPLSGQQEAKFKLIKKKGVGFIILLPFWPA